MTDRPTTPPEPGERPSDTHPAPGDPDGNVEATGTAVATDADPDADVRVPEGKRGPGDLEAGDWLTPARAPGPAVPIPVPALWGVLVTGVLATLLLTDGVGVNLLLVALPAAYAAYAAGRAAGRRTHAWSLVWAVGGLALLAIPALRDADWPSSLAVLTALAAGSLALHGGRRWPAVLLGPIGVFQSLVTGPRWGWQGVRARSEGARGRIVPVLRALVVTVVLLLVFGALFAGADAAFAGLLGDLMPEASFTGGFWHVLMLALGLVGALAAAHTASAPPRWDRVRVPGGRARGRAEWALPLVVLVLLFASFNAVQLTVLFGGYDAVLRETGESYAEYARQGFWQLLLATLLTLVVIVLALRWAPRGGARDRRLVRGVLGTLCALALVVVASAVRRMDMYVEAYGLTRLRLSVTAVEWWLGLVIVLIMAAGVWGARWLPRAVAAGAVAGVLAFGLASPDALVAERNVQRYEETGRFDLDYADGLSADAVPALDRLAEPMRSCALRRVARDLAETADAPWYATSRGRSRARDLLAERPVSARADIITCGQLGSEALYG
ncbi:MULTISPECIES: DUF4173 domain-containing protein [unclassified Streptomyces]|uniref:DUF4153 domain-containing protein n=1 Tax=unclassified Streptomyces TaxID=2593676 RepID=UPI001F18EF4B|nr:MULTISPECIES: DUF4173 domain-containing protein [unclassified Streptomyces]MCF0086935.1 hypothetical protein [Streptomyces sp. MH192]MCF0101896.1 hypothetical protein [Streptomyces sp. MH191]